MNRLEFLEAKVVALSIRVEALECGARGRLAVGAVELAAQRVAQELGFSADVLVVPRQVQKRRALARALRARGWSVTRIARALHCSERTVERGFARATVSRHERAGELPPAE